MRLCAGRGATVEQFGGNISREAAGPKRLKGFGESQARRDSRISDATSARGRGGTRPSTASQTDSRRAARVATPSWSMASERLERCERRKSSKVHRMRMRPDARHQPRHRAMRADASGTRADRPGDGAPPARRVRAAIAGCRAAPSCASRRATRCRIRCSSRTPRWCSTKWPIITRPGAVVAARRDRGRRRRDGRHRPLVHIEAPATLDGGDVLTVGRRVFVGESARTNRAAISQMARHLAPLGYTVHIVPVRGCLHLKSAVTAVSDDTLLINPEWVPAERFPSADADRGASRRGVRRQRAARRAATVIYPRRFPGRRRVSRPAASAWRRSTSAKSRRPKARSRAAA